MKMIKNDKGFTFVEMLVCVITLLLIGMICSVGVSMASKSYQDSVFESDSQLLESTLNLYISDILRFATDVEVDASGKVTEITNDTYHMKDGNIVLSERSGQTGGFFVLLANELDTQGTLLISEASYGGELYIEAFELTYDENKAVFSGKYVIKSDVALEKEKECNFSYRVAGMIR